MSNKINSQEKCNLADHDLRRKNLKLILDKYFFSITSLAEKLNINRANLSTLLSGTRPFSSYTANKIESLLALPHGYLSSESEVNEDLNSFIISKYYEDLKYIVGSSFQKKIKIPVELIKHLKLNNQSEILVSHMNDDLMNPTIKLNEMILVDTQQDKIEDNKLYLIEINGFYRVRRLIINDHIVSIHIDSPENLKGYIVKSFDITDIKVIGKVIGIFSNLN